VQVLRGLKERVERIDSAVRPIEPQVEPSRTIFELVHAFRDGSYESTQRFGFHPRRGKPSQFGPSLVIALFGRMWPPSPGFALPSPAFVFRPIVLLGFGIRRLRLEAFENLRDAVLEKLPRLFVYIFLRGTIGFDGENEEARRERNLFPRPRRRI